MKNYIDNELNASKKTFLDSTKEGYEELKSIDEIIASLEVLKHDYEEKLLISNENDFQIHYKRPPNSCFENNYFCDFCDGLGSKYGYSTKFRTIAKQLHTCVLNFPNLK